MKSSKPTWLKQKGYLHLTPQIDVVRREQEIIRKISNPNFVKTYAFYPLIHSSIQERKFKRIPDSSKRGHSYKNGQNNTVLNLKQRPLHYSSHMDALIFGYYADLLQKKYEEVLSKNPDLSNCIIAYRKIPCEDGEKNKSTIHFAKEVFDEIKEQASNECSVLMFDIKSFFSRIDHGILKKAWMHLINVDVLPKDHENVFKASTKFSYILKDDLRVKNTQTGRKSGFDEKNLDQIRKDGKFSYFSSPKEFRDKVKSKEIKIFKSPFTLNKIPVGIPQGLAISAVLANLYLLEFDKKVHEKIVSMNGFYRRYSDDMLIICKPTYVDELKIFISKLIEESKVEISKAKTEEYFFKTMNLGHGKYKINSVKISEARCQLGVPLTYLGFEFYGDKTLIKSTNLARFYRRMIYSVKSKASRANKLAKISPDNKRAVFRRQLYKLYTLQDLNTTKIRKSIKKLVKDERGFYKLKVLKIEKPLKSNYLSYVTRASFIMDDLAIQNQIRNHKRIFNEAINRQLQRTEN